MTKNTSSEAILGLLLLFPENSDEIAEKIRPQWFQGVEKKAIDLLFQGDCDAVALHEAGIPSEKVAKWMEAECTLSALDRHAQNLEKAFTDRGLKWLGRGILSAKDNAHGLKLIDDFQNLMTTDNRNEPVSSMEGTKKLAKELERRSQQKGLLGMSYGLIDLDAETEGLHRGDLVTVAAPSSMGKTAFASGVVESAAQAGNSALIFSCEMTVEQLLMRTLAAKSRVPLTRIRSAKFKDTDWSKMTGAFGEISKLPLWIDDSANLSISEIARKTKRYRRKHGIKIVLIDYLQIMAYDKTDEVRELDRITTGLKNLAKSENVCVILLSQLNRSSQAQNRQPQMTDLRGSGMIENNSDVILFPWRPGANCEKCRKKIVTDDHNPATCSREASIIIAKQRQGPRNKSVPVIWREEVTRFENLAKVSEE